MTDVTESSGLSAELMKLWRRSIDTARALEAVASEHRPEWERCSDSMDPTKATAEKHERALELYPHVIENERAARQMREEARILFASANVLSAADILIQNLRAYNAAAEPSKELAALGAITDRFEALLNGTVGEEDRGSAGGAPGGKSRRSRKSSSGG